MLCSGLINSVEIAKEIKKISPHKIAVAFIGIGWESYINPDTIESIVVSPNFGSNPHAIKELARKIGWDKIWLHNYLHSKIYIGNDSIIVGSANLTDNALGDTPQNEACFLTQEKSVVTSATELFNSYIETAKNHFGTEEAKRERIKELQEQWDYACENGLIEKSQHLKVPSFNEFDLNKNKPIFVSSSDYVDYQYTSAVPEEIKEEDPLNFVIADDDKFPENHWVLFWKRNPKSKTVRSKSILEWMYVHSAIKKGSDYKGYSTVCIQRKGTLPPVPFDAEDDKFRKAFKKIIDLPKFENLRGYPSDDEYRFKDNHVSVQELFKNIQSEYRKG